MTKDTLLFSKLDSIAFHLNNIKQQTHSDIDAIYLKLSKDSILINSIDSIAKRVSFLQHQADMDTGVSLNHFLAFGGGMLLAYLGFFWNRNKEYRSKRGEIAGEIHVLIFDLKMALWHQTRNCIYYMANKRIIDIITDPEFYYTLDEWEQQNYDPSSYKEWMNTSLQSLNEERRKLFKARRLLSKHFGQYKFYLSSQNRTEFNEEISKLLKVKFLEYSFEDLTDVLAIEERKNLLLKTYTDDVRRQYKNQVDCIETFLEASID